MRATSKNASVKLVLRLIPGPPILFFSDYIYKMLRAMGWTQKVSTVEDVPRMVHGPADSKLRAKRNAVAWRRGKDISYRQDESHL